MVLINNDIIYIFPKSRFFAISRPVMRIVLYSVGMSSVDEKVSASPNGIISGIQPAKIKDAQSLLAAAGEFRTRTPCIFHRPASFVHFVLLGDATTHKVHVARPIPLHLERTGLERPLLADEDVEVVVGGVEARVPLRAERRAKDDEVLGDAGVYDVHRAHRAARIVEHPF